MSKLSFTLIENANDFLKESLSKAIEAEKNHREWKFAIFCLVQSIELCLKEKLRLEHPSLVFNDIDRQNTTVSLEKATSRLEKISTISFPPKDISTIMSAVKIRNSIIHFDCNLNIKQLKSIYGKLIGFLKDFYEDHLNINFYEILNENLWKEVLEIESFGRDLYKRAIQKINKLATKEPYLITCPKCWHNTFVGYMNQDKCYLCSFQEKTTVCQECGIGLFMFEAHTVYYGMWYNGNGKNLREWWPELCDNCLPNYLETSKDPRVK